MSQNERQDGHAPADASVLQELGIRLKEPGEVVRTRHFSGNSIRQTPADIGKLLAKDTPQDEKSVLTNPLATTGSIVQTQNTARALQDIDAERGAPHSRPDESGKAADFTAEQNETATKDGVVLPFPAFVGAAVGEQANDLGGGHFLQWEPPGLQKAGKNPDGQRRFIGDEFPRMLAYGAPKFHIGTMVDPQTGKKQRAVLGLKEEAKPAFFSYSKDGKSAPKKMNIVIATSYETMPKYMKTGEVAATMEARKEFAFNKQTLEEAFSAPGEKIRRAYEIAAKDITATTGIEFDIRLDTDPKPHKEKDVHITLLGFKNGNERLAGFASFPEAVNDWEDLDGLGHKQGFALVNTDYCDHPTISPYKIYDLLVHEGGGLFGHNLGMVHPHDLGTMRMSQAEALSATVMSYTDNVFCGPDIFDEENKIRPSIIEKTAHDVPNMPIIYDLNAEKRPGVMCGVVDYGIRNFCANAPRVTGQDNLIYDMDLARKHNQNLHEKNHTDSVNATGLPAFLPIDATGQNTTLVGTGFSDVIDTEPGHVSRTPRTDLNRYEQRFAITAGHIERVVGRGGNNRIFLSSKGDQLIEPGPGSNTVYMYADRMEGAKTIDCSGRPDTLVIHESLLMGENALEPIRDQDDLILGSKENGIILKDQFLRGKGITKIKVVSDNALTDDKVIFSRDVSNFTSMRDFERDFVNAAKRDIRRNEKANPTDKAHDGHDPDEAPTHDHSQCAGPHAARHAPRARQGGNQGWLDRVSSTADAASAGVDGRGWRH